MISFSYGAAARRRPLLKIVTVLAPAALLLPLSATPAAADKPAREVIEVVADESDSDVCGFTVHLLFEGTIIRTTYTDEAGNVVRIREVYPNYRMTATNVLTSETFEAAIPGPFVIDLHPDGSTTQVGTGPWFFGGRNPDTREPGMFLLTGRWVLETDPQGQTTLTRAGRLVDLCAILAA
jgi:hypothetical protein